MYLLRLLGLIGAAVTLSLPAMATTYNVVSGFNGSQNPSGVWSYRDGSGSLLTHSTTSGIGTPQWDNNSGYPGASIVAVNAGSATSSGTVYYAADAAHLDGQGVGAEIRFTAAMDDTFNVSGGFSYGDNNMTSHTVSIVDNAGNVLFSAYLTNGRTQSFALAGVSLAAGGWLDFVTGTDGGASYAGTNLQASVSDLPEPTGLALLPIGLLGLRLARRRSAHTLPGASALA